MTRDWPIVMPNCLPFVDERRLVKCKGSAAGFSFPPYPLPAIPLFALAPCATFPWLSLSPAKRKRKRLLRRLQSRFSNYQITGSPSLGNRANRSCISYLTICELRSDPKFFFTIISIRICRIVVRSWHHCRDILPIKRDACSWREFLARKCGLWVVLHSNDRLSL